MEKIMLFFQLFQKGKEVANPELWKAHQITGTAVAGLLIILMKLSKSLGYELPFNEQDAMQLGGAIIVLFNIVLTFITSKRVGVGSVTSEPTAVAPVASQPVPAPVESPVPVPQAMDGLLNADPEPNTTRTVGIPTDTSGDIAEIQVRTVKRRRQLPEVPTEEVQSLTKPNKPGDTYFG